MAKENICKYYQNSFQILDNSNAVITTKLSMRFDKESHIDNYENAHILL